MLTQGLLISTYCEETNSCQIRNSVQVRLIVSKMSIYCPKLGSGLYMYAVTNSCTCTSICLHVASN